MNKQQQINEDLKTAMKAKDELSVSVLRQLKAALTNAALATGNASNPLSDNETIAVVRKQIKQREDSVEQFIKGNREELAEKEKNEIFVLKKILPQELTENEVDELVKKAIFESGATSKKEMGKAIKLAVEFANGRIDNKTLSVKIGQFLQ